MDNNDKVYRDKKKTVSLQRVDKNSVMYSLFDMNIPPSENDELEPRETKPKDRTKVGRENKGIITNEVISKDRTTIDLDSDGNNLEYNDNKRAS